MAIYFRSTGTNWGTIGDWSSTPSPVYTAVAAIPTAADDVIFEAASANCTLNVAGTCLSFNASTYGAKTWSLGTNNISVGAGVFTLGTGMTVTGTGTLIKAGVGALTSNGVTWPGSVQTNVNTTYTWGSNWTIVGSFTSANNATFNGAFNITIGGSLTHSALTSGSTTYILNGTGNLNGTFGTAAIIINTAFTITLPTVLTISGGTLRLTSGTVSVTSGHSFIPAGCTLDTDRTSTGGNKISFYNYTSINSSTITLQSNLTVTNNFTNTNNITTAGVFNIYVGGNYAQTGTIGGTATLILDGTANATIGTGAININLIINKSGAGVVTPSITMSWGATNKTLTMNSAVNFLANSTTFTLLGTLLTINNSSVSQFFNMTVPTNLTLNINNNTTPILGTLSLLGNATFAGTYGFTTNNFTCTVANSIITLQNIVAFPSAQYIVNGVLTLIGTAGSRIVLQAAGSATFNGTITPVGQLNVTSGTPPSVGMILSQATLVSPVGLIGLLPNRPEITSIITAGTTFGITPAATTVIGASFSMRAGYKAKFTLTNGTGSQNVGYVQTQDIDSNGGATITSFGSNGDDINNSTIALFRTLNWGPLVASSGSVYYTFVN